MFMKVLFISHSLRDTYLPISGGFIFEQALALKKNGVDVSIVAVNLISLKSVVKFKKIDFGYRCMHDHEMLQMVYQIPSIPFLKGLNTWIRNKLLVRLIKKNISENGAPQIAHVHVFYSGKAAIWLKQKMKIPYVITEHFSVFAQKLTSKKELKFAQNIYANASACIGVSNVFCSFLSEKFKIPFIYIPNTVNIDLFTISENKPSGSVKKIISVGSLTKNKNHEMLIKSISSISDNIHLTIVGDGLLKNHLQNLVVELGMVDKVTFYGLASQPELVKLLQESDIFVLPSLYETFAVVLIEAMACGLPVVATKCGGPQSIITSNCLGELCEISENELRTKITKVINTEYDSDIIRNYVLQNYSSKVFAEKVIDVYHPVVCEN